MKFEKIEKCQNFNEGISKIAGLHWFFDYEFNKYARFAGLPPNLVQFLHISKFLQIFAHIISNILIEFWKDFLNGKVSIKIIKNFKILGSVPISIDLCLGLYNWPNSWNSWQNMANSISHRELLIKIAKVCSAISNPNWFLTQSQNFSSLIS